MCSSSVDGWRLVGDWPTWKQLEMPSAAQEHDIRVYCPVMDTLGAMGKAAAPYIALLKARLEAL